MATKKRGRAWWRVSGTVTVSAYTYVLADDGDEAIEIARGSRDVALCPGGPSRHGTNPTREAVAEDGDGEFEPFEVEPEEPDAEWLDEDEEPGDEDIDVDD